LKPVVSYSLIEAMTTPMFASRRDDGSAQAAAVFHASLEEARDAVQQAIEEWNETLEGIDTTADLASEPPIVSSVEGFRVVFQIQPGSRLWKDWAVGSCQRHQQPTRYGLFRGVLRRCSWPHARDKPAGSL
jgi:hypothetical protein